MAMKKIKRSLPDALQDQKTQLKLQSHNYFEKQQGSQSNMNESKSHRLTQNNSNNALKQQQQLFKQQQLLQKNINSSQQFQNINSIQEQIQDNGSTLKNDQFATKKRGKKNTKGPYKLENAYSDLFESKAFKVYEKMNQNQNNEQEIVKNDDKQQKQDHNQNQQKQSQKQILEKDYNNLYINSLDNITSFNQSNQIISQTYLGTMVLIDSETVWLEIENKAASGVSLYVVAVIYGLIFAYLYKLKFGENDIYGPQRYQKTCVTCLINFLF
ncbi:hypothetical protein PPERSA_11853 [Pseudocohnilembus persalinus]|uniref:Transmembrane protein n=1 Tax=Pseudocohnilembus persalinus TaxID=266149 RepID=A0A0V0QJW5_PSEPJ|nr:hypothetical protein PPERSA_11853 [Pseudocohnilembus persalinus]|eukprot:KRX02513.1 hypothetical protein PPERSA_11853 [Pseudocohnilembus persalinus]